jgi:uncharacterized delta-60 repeat protein
MGSMVGLPSITHTSQNLVISKRDTNPGGYLLEWNASYGTIYHDYGRRLYIDNDNYVYLVGCVYNTSQSAYDAFVVKYNWAGMQQLEINYDYNGLNDEVNDVAVDSSGNIYLAGTTEDGMLDGVHADSILIKYNSAGELVTPAHFGSPTYSDEGKTVGIDGSGNIYLAGALGTSTGTNLFLARYDSSFSFDWSTGFGGASDDRANDIAIDEGGYIYLVGDTKSYGDGNNDLLLAKYSSSGVRQWNDTFGWDTSEVGTGIILDDSRCLISSYSDLYSGTTAIDIVFPKFLKTTGSTSSWSYFRGDSYDYGYDIAKDSNGDIFIAGSTYSYGAGHYDALIIKYAENYTKLWNFTYGSSNYETCRAIEIDGRDNIYIAGLYTVGAGNYSAYLVKFGLDEDGDGLTYDEEVFTYFTNPHTEDFDMDGYSDGAEVDAGTNPLDPNDYPGATTTTEIPGFELITVIITLIGIIGLLGLIFKLKNQQKIKL